MLASVLNEQQTFIENQFTTFEDQLDIRAEVTKNWKEIQKLRADGLTTSRSKIYHRVSWK